MSTPDQPAVPDGSTARPGLTIASLVAGAIGLVLAVTTWLAWLLVPPMVRPDNGARGIDVVVELVLGAAWFLVLPVAAVGALLALLGARRAPATRRLAAFGGGVAGLALALAIAGVVVFVAGTA